MTCSSDVFDELPWAPTTRSPSLSPGTSTTGSAGCEARRRYEPPRIARCIARGCRSVETAVAERGMERVPTMERLPARGAALRGREDHGPKARQQPQHSDAATDNRLKTLRPPP